MFLNNRIFFLYLNFKPIAMTEKEELLHYVWKYRLFSQDNLATHDNEKIEIIDVGLHNFDSGPDFFNAKIKIGDKVWAGNVEIHRTSDEWRKHKHDTDESYNSVILHVVEQINCEVKNAKGMIVPQMRLIVPEQVQRDADYLLSSASNIPCKKHLSEMDAKLLHAWLNVLTIERLERKTDDIFNHLKRFNHSWDESFYVLLSRNYGFGLNSNEFERLAMSLPFSYVQKHGDSLFQVEAMLFGQAGMLEDDKVLDDYYLQLKNEYRFIRNKFTLKPLESFLFKKLRVRPNAFPQVRIAQLAALLQQSGRLFSTILAKEDYRQLRLYFQAETSPYWKTHYSFGKESQKSDKYLGDSSLDILLINTVAPMLFAYGKKTNQEIYIDRALHILESVKAERNAIVNEFKESGIVPANAADSQALIQLRKEYCDKRKCLYCKIGYKILAR